MASAHESTLPASLHAQRKNLKCGICQDVFQSPKLLPCFHTFCQKCLEQLVAVKGSPFHCPSCRSETRMPAEGPKGFQSNMYITEEELERARENVMLCRVHSSYDEPLTLFCLVCDECICLRCKLTKHEGHRCEDLVKANNRGRQLARAKREMDDVVDLLENTLQQSEEHLKEIDVKKAILVEQVNVRHDHLVAMAAHWKNNALKDLNINAKLLKNSVKSERDHQSSYLSNCRMQRKRVQEVIDNLSKDTLDISEAHRVLSTCSETESLRKKVRMPSSDNPVFRPGLYCSMQSIRDHVVRDFIGMATVLQIPSMGMGPARETISRFYQCLEDGKPRPVLALCVTDDDTVHCMYQDLAQGREQWGKRTIGFTGQPLRDNKVRQKFIFRKFANGEKFCISHYKDSNGICLNSKSGSLAQIQYQLPGSSAFAQCTLNDVLVVDDPVVNQPKLSSSHFVQNIHTQGTPLAVDVSADNSLVAVLEEVVDTTCMAKEQTQVGESRRLVRLYRRGQDDCIATYQPQEPASFYPTDVCFWRSGGLERLLVGDFNNDCIHVIVVHVINAHKGRCVLERYLAPGCGALMKPTAFDTDPEGRLWIGCANGWILKCEALPGFGKDDHEDDIKDIKEEKLFCF